MFAAELVPEPVRNSGGSVRGQPSSQRRPHSGSELMLLDFGS
jgi:hypothetical protein